MPVARFNRALGALLVFFLFTEFSNSTLAAGANEYQIKAAFIYKFCLYIDWPPQAFSDGNAPLTIGVAGPNEIASELRAVTQGRKIAGRTLSIVQVNNADIPALQVLYIVTPEMPEARKLIAHALGTPTLLITENSAGNTAGSVINFAMQENRVRFDINIDAAAQQGLHVGAQLLQVARSVESHPAEKGDAP